MRKISIALAAAALLSLTACGGDSSAAEETTTTSPSSSSSAAPSTSKAAPSSSAPSRSAPWSWAPAETPEQQFLAAMRASGIVPQIGSDADLIDLATTICVAFGSGQSFVEVSATLAGGSLSLGQIIDLIQAATQHYCPRFYVPES